MDSEIGVDYGTDYYRQYRKKNFFGKMSGERSYLYLFWRKFLENRLAQGTRVLDLGCGIGFLTKHLSESFEVIGTDVSKYALDKALEIAPKAKFVLTTEDRLPFETESFGAVVAFDVLEHQDNPAQMIGEIYRVLKSGGILAVSMPNVASVGKRFKGARWYAYQDKTHVSLLKREEWVKLLKNAGFERESFGTDFLWDVPYVSFIPQRIQKLCLVSVQWVLVRLFGYLPWSLGETLTIVVFKTAP